MTETRLPEVGHAVALLGSEDAVRKYVEGEQPKKEEKSNGPVDLFGNPP
jgi:hypothetical protein